jgi:ferredoxin
MGTATIPRTFTGHTASYTDLTEAQHDRFDRLMDQADTTIDAGIYNELMLAAAHLTGIDIAPGGEIARCACTWCTTCPVIFDTALPDLRQAEETTSDYNLPRLQCPDCADDHPAHTED